MLRAIDELIQTEGLDTDLNFVLYWLDEDDSEKIEFLNYEDIRPVTTLTGLFQDKAFDFMWDFIKAIDSIKDDNATKTIFYLPPKFEEKYKYHITAMGPFLYEGDNFFGYGLEFMMVIETSMGSLPLKLEISDVPTPESGEYTNIIIVDELGNIVRPEEKNGKYYYNECPSNFVNLDPGQNLIIEREGDFVKITETGNT